MGIVSSAKFTKKYDATSEDEFQSPMGIVSSAKSSRKARSFIIAKVSIPDGDSFLREAECNVLEMHYTEVSIPDGDSFLREARSMIGFRNSFICFNPHRGLKRDSFPLEKSISARFAEETIPIGD